MLHRLLNLPLRHQIGSVGDGNKLGRDTWLAKTLQSIPSGQRILDAGAGQLQYAGLCSHLRYVSQDFGQYDGTGNRVGLQVGDWDQSGVDIVCDITEIPEPDESFDAIMCIEVLEHVPYPVDALREFDRLLRPGGRLILTAPFCALTHYAPHFYQTGYSSYFYLYWMENLGFDVIELVANGNYYEYLAQEMRRLPKVAESYANSKLRWYEKAARQILLAALNRFSARNHSSEELLCYGFHLLAQKRTSSR